MKKLNLTEVTNYVEAHIGTFHQKRIERLSNLKLKTVLKRKNPYLFRAKHLITAEEIVKGITVQMRLFPLTKRHFLETGSKAWQFLSTEKCIRVGSQAFRILILSLTKTELDISLISNQVRIGGTVVRLKRCDQTFRRLKKRSGQEIQS